MSAVNQHPDEVRGTQAPQARAHAPNQHPDEVRGTQAPEARAHAPNQRRIAAGKAANVERFLAGTADWVRSRSNARASGN